MEYKLHHAIMDIIIGLILIVLSLCAIIYQEDLLMRIYDILGFIIILNGIKTLLDYIKSKNTNQLKESILFISGGVILLLYTNIPLSLTRIVLAIFVLGYSVVRFISYYFMKINKVGGRLAYLIITIIAMAIGWYLLLGKYINISDAILFIGIYGCLLGMSYIYTGIRVALPDHKKNILKRKIRVPLPVAVAAIMPRSALDSINSCVLIDNNFKYLEDNYRDDVLEVFVHVTRDGFGTLGHCDIWFDNEILSYGNYDDESVKLFETIGDGVLFTCKNKMEYLNFCIKESKKTIFGYKILLNPDQINSIKKRILDLKDNTFPWHCKGYYNSQETEDYASRLYHETKAKFYKFNKGKFKNYFVLGTNCVLLADTIIGGSGSDILDINGIITPGAYYNYLEKENQRIEGIVAKKTIYQ